MARRSQEEEEEKENFPLITTKTVEYLQPVMRRELLRKFPDNSAFGFDYAQSSLWNLELGEFLESKKQMKISMKKKNKKKKLVKLDMSSIKSDDSPKVGCFSLPTKGWDGLLKVASKHFKKSKKKRDPVADVKLLNFCKC
ncbi:uncharacterized protein LOC103833501 isoform X2 [Brassica rapa]|uniref:uncharacterized protein LOC103833501 isoform X2 n=1 Tax=Brassica campestris TaxID=3711 RepID=UPI0004F187BF|nr:uncharacterized protein LOC103833501 isoform X2 [Brassica rapa]